ncbi:MAG: DUF2846 domain-containing protein [Acidiferrobacteraceae bacterium]
MLLFNKTFYIIYAAAGLILIVLPSQPMSAIAQSPAPRASVAKSPGRSVAAYASANTDVLKMLKAGLPESVVLAKIHMEPGKFDTSADALIALKKAGASEAVLDAVLDHGKPADQQAVPASQAPTISSVAPVSISQTGTQPSMTPAKMDQQPGTVQGHAAADSNTPEAVGTSFVASTSRSGQVASTAPTTNPDKMAQVYFYRPHQALGVGSGVNPSIYCDGIRLGALRPLSFLLIDIPIGRHRFYMGGETEQEKKFIKTEPTIDIDLKSGESYYYMIKFRTGGFFGKTLYSFPITSIQSEQAEQEINQLRPLEGQYISHDALPSGVVVNVTLPATGQRSQ